MIYVEDNSDQYLLEYLNKPYKKIWRAEGKQDVVKKVMKENGSIGIIDYDDDISNEIVDMELDENHKHVLLYKYKESFLIVIIPRLQNWLINACQEAGKSPSDFGLPDKTGDFHKAINKEVRKPNL